MRGASGTGRRLAGTRSPRRRRRGFQHPAHGHPRGRVKDPRARIYIIDHLKPGTTIHRRVEVHNDSPKRQHVELYPVGATIEENTFAALPGRNGNELSSWVSTELGSVDLPPRAKKPIKVTIRVPDTASTGERYAAVLAQVTQPPTDGGNIGQIRRVDVRIYLNIGPGGEAPTDFRIGTMSVSPGPGQWPIVAAQVHNTGRRALDMTGALSLSRESGTAKAALSNHLGRPVRLSRELPPDARLHRTPPDDVDMVPDCMDDARPGQETALIACLRKHDGPTFPQPRALDRRTPGTCHSDTFHHRSTPPAACADACESYQHL